MPKIVLAIDLDDTLCDTQAEVVRRLRHYLYDHAMFDDLKWVYNAIGKISTMMYPPHLREIISNRIIKQGDYVKTVLPGSLIATGQLTALFGLLKDFPGEVKTVIATHRYTENEIEANTHGWLTQYEVKPHLHDIHFINGQFHSNKIDFLRERYPEHEILLLDDNPFGQLHHEHLYSPNVVVYDKLGKYDAYKHQTVFTDIVDLIGLMLSMTQEQKKVS